MSWWQYLLLVNIYLVLFYTFYVLLLRKETFFQLNRVYLVTVALLSFFIPVIQSNWVQNLFITQQVKYTIYSSPIIIYNLKPIEDASINWGELFMMLYLSGSVFLLSRLIWQLIKLKKVINSTTTTTMPFSFFKSIKLDESNADNSVIEVHEQVHARQWHSADVLLIELVMIVNWFNPVVYLYRFAIKHIHEYIADRQAVQTGTSKADYALLLLTQTFHAPAHQLVNPFFNHSLLKQRIIMLQKNKSQRVSLIKYGLSAPLFILMLILSSATINNSKTVTAINTKASELFLKSAQLAITDETSPELLTISDTTTAKGKVYSQVETLPEFPGGFEAFAHFLGSNIKYPGAAREHHIQGKVVVTFVVETDGALSGVKILRKLGYGCDEESVRVLKISPKWKPGMQKGRKVRVQYSVPINYTLDDGKKNDVNDKKTGGILPQKSSNDAVYANNQVNDSSSENAKAVSVAGKADPLHQPVYMLNEKEVSGSEANALDVNKIESVTILNSKSNKAQDGVKGANSIVKIVLKKSTDLNEHPLYLIDDKKVAESDFKSLDPNKIESVNVIKGKDATTLYGGKASGGIIKVMLKK